MIILAALAGLGISALRRDLRRAKRSLSPRRPRKKPTAKAVYRPAGRQSRHGVRPAKLTGIDQSSAQPAPFEVGSSHVVTPAQVLCGAAYVIDGDSLVINETQIRLFGVDAPEINHPYGKNAKWALIGLCKGRTIRAEIIQEDHFGRTVAKCTLPDGRDLSAEMVSRGWAIDWSKFSGGVYAHLEVPDARKKMWLADARQKGRMHVWKEFDEREKAKKAASKP